MLQENSKLKISIDHVNLTVKSFRDSSLWYEKVFGFKVVEKGVGEEGHEWGILRSGDTMLAISESPKRILDTGDHFHRIYHFGFKIEDKEVWESKLDEYQLETHFNSPVLYPNSISWYVKDPTGHTIEVSLWNNNKIEF